MADIRVKDLDEASTPGADYYLLTDSATDGVKKVKTTNVVVPVASGVSGLGTGVATFLATPSSANLASALTDETGSGAAVFATSPTLVTPTLGAAAATSINKVAVTAPATGATLTIADGKTLTASGDATVSGTNTGDQTITLTGDVTGTGTGSFATTIGATKVTSAMLNADVFSTAHTWSGQQTFVAPILGTPASGVATNLTGTASGLTAGTVTTNANLTGDVTSVGNATTIGATKVTSAMLNSDVFSSTHTWSGVQTFSAAPVVPTQSPSDNSTKAASTAYVDAQVAGGVAGVASIDGLTGAFTTDDSIDTTSKVIRSVQRGHIWGLGLSNNTTDATNDIDIAVGEASDASGNLMVLASGLTKRLDAAWAVGTNQGGLDTGAIADGTYHVWLIQRSDTGVVDALFSTSASAPTMPTSYDRKRRIGSIIRSSGAILAFTQVGDEFLWNTVKSNVASATGTTTAQTATLTVPSGIIVRAKIAVGASRGANLDARFVVSELDKSDEAPSNTTLNFGASAASGAGQVWTRLSIRTNSSAQIRYRASDSTGSIFINTIGWIDPRGSNGWL